MTCEFPQNRQIWQCKLSHNTFLVFRFDTPFDTLKEHPCFQLSFWVHPNKSHMQHWLLDKTKTQSILKLLHSCGKWTELCGQDFGMIWLYNDNSCLTGKKSKIDLISLLIYSEKQNVVNVIFSIKAETATLKVLLFPSRYHISCLQRINSRYFNRVFSTRSSSSRILRNISRWSEWHK